MRRGPTEVGGVQLMQNEAVLEDVNPAWSAYVGSLLFGAVLLLGALAEATVVDSQNDASAAAVMGVVVFGVIFGYAFYRRSRTHYIVTDSRVIKRTGILLNSSTEEAGYEMITGVGVDASRFQSLFGNGTVNVATSGGVGTIELTGAPDAQEFANLIRERHPTLGARGRGGPPGGQPQGRAPQGGRGQPRGGRPQGRDAGQNPQGGTRQRGGRQQGGQPRDVDGARGAEGPRRRGERGGHQQGRQGRGEPSKRERRQERADQERRGEQRRQNQRRGDDRRADDRRRDERRDEGGRSDRARSGRADANRDRRDGDRAPESDGPVDRTPSSGGDPVGDEAGGRRSAGGGRGGDREADPSSDERRRRDDEDEEEEDGPAWDPDGR